MWNDSTSVNIAPFDRSWYMSLGKNVALALVAVRHSDASVPSARCRKPKNNANGLRVETSSTVLAWRDRKMMTPVSRSLLTEVPGHAAAVNLGLTGDVVVAALFSLLSDSVMMTQISRKCRQLDPQDRTWDCFLSRSQPGSHLWVGIIRGC